MNYELAKQLKDAGWPQNRPDVADQIDIEYLHRPTLEELIEACGIDFIALDHKADGQWLAGGGRREKDYFSYQFFASTPSEAVAKLWLALNPKKELKD